MSRDNRDEPTIRCGYCNQRFPAVQARNHWTWSLCNLRWARER